MKKLISLLVLVVMFFSFVACGNESAFDGNYKNEADQATATATVQSIRQENANISSQVAQSGYKIKSFVEVDIDAGQSSFYIKSESNGKAVYTNGPMKAAMDTSAKIIADILGDYPINVNAQESGKVYVVNDTVYQDTVKKSNGQSIPIKIQFPFNMIDDYEDYSVVELDDFLSDSYLNVVEELVEDLEDINLNNIKVYVDETDGIKIKIVFGEDFQTKAEFADMLEDMDDFELLSNANLQVSMNDCYVIMLFDANKKFQGVKTYYDFTATANVLGNTYSATFKTNNELTVYTGDVSVPSTFTGYVPIS